MDLLLLRIMQRQIRDQCRFVLLSAHGINQGLQGPDFDIVFFSIQNFLNATANISKMLWGQKGKFAEARKPLRDSLGIEENSPLRQVNMRNNFEHMDERIYRWWETSIQHIHVDRIIGPPGTVGTSSVKDIFRTFDPSSTDVGFWGEEFNIQMIVDEINIKLPLIEVEASKPPW